MGKKVLDLRITIQNVFRNYIRNTGDSFSISKKNTGMERYVPNLNIFELLTQGSWYGGKKNKIKGKLFAYTYITSLLLKQPVRSRGKR